MKKYLHIILGILTTLAIGAVILFPESAQAQTTMITEIAEAGINNALASFANWILMVTAWLVTIGGVFLNVSIIITMKIKDLYTEIDSIRTVWVTIRDLSSIFVIFLLLYSALKMVLGINTSDFGKLVVKIFLAGIFINFSLFFVKVAVDASNLVSLQFYRAIAPNASLSMRVENAFTDGGISNVFMNSLKIPKIYDNTNTLKAADVFTSISFALVGGIIMMVATAFSFFAAAIAFIARTGILLFIMALSPILVLGMVFPEVKSKFKTLFSMFTGQLFFMPAYLGLMYIALRLITDPNFTNIFNPAVTGTTASQDALGAVTIGVIVQYTIAILFINAPLAAALSLGGSSVEWANGVTNRLRGVLGRNTLGRAGRFAGEKFDSLAAAAQGNKFGRGVSSVLRLTKISQATRGGLEKLEKGKYASKYSLGDIEKEDKTRSAFIDTKRTEKKREDGFDELFDGDSIPATTDVKTVKSALSKMSSKQIEGLGKKLQDPKVAAALTSKQMEGILKPGNDISESDKDKIKESRVKGMAGNIAKGELGEIKNLSEGDMENLLKEDFSNEQKDELKKARKETLNHFVAKADSDGLAEYMKKLSTKELITILEDGGTATTAPDLVIQHLKPGQLKEMEKMKDPLRKYIGSQILAWTRSHSSNHPAIDHVHKNMSLWGPA